MTITVLRAGAYTTVQDAGRRGWQRDGVPVSGAMDDVALRLANALVGNAPGAAVLEATLRGPSLSFAEDAYVAVTGADMDARIDGRRLAPWWAAPVPAGSTLTLDVARAGCRACIAVAGGFDAPVILGSRSAYPRAGMGRRIDRGHVFGAGSHSPTPGPRPPARRGANISHLGLDRPSVRLVAGPHLATLDHSSWRALFESPFVLRPDSDRMGLRFDGAPLATVGNSEPLSAPVTMGTIQLPPGGAPIILMADRQTTGGYPRLGEIASVDLPVLAQLRPGDSIRFEQVAIDVAEQMYLARERELSAMSSFLLHTP